MQRLAVDRRAGSVIEALAVGVAAMFVVAFIATAASRLGIDAPLTDVRRGTVQQVRRVLEHQALFPAPSSTFVPLVYPPLYFYASAATARITGIGYLPLRLTSLIASLATIGLIAVWVWRETRDWRASAIAAGLFAATYRITDAWFDVERVDALAVALLVAALYTLRHAQGTLAAAGAGLLMMLSALTKQTGLLVGAVMVLYLLATDRRRALAFGGALIAGTALSAILLNSIEGGGYTSYVYRLAAHGMGGADVIGRWAHGAYAFFTHDLFGAVGIALVVGSLALIDRAADAGTRSTGSRFFFPAAVAAVLVAALASRVVHESRQNALLPAYAIIAMLFGLGVPRLVALVDARVVPRAWVWSVVLVQMAMLAYVPWHLRPLLSDRVDPVLILGGAPGTPHARAHDLAWAETHRSTYADPTAVAEFLTSAPTGAAETYLASLQRDICAATDEHPLIVSAYLFDPAWQAATRATLAPAAPMLPTWEQAASRCRTAESTASPR